MSNYHDELVSTGQNSPDSHPEIVFKRLIKINKSNDFSNKTLLDAGCGNGETAKKLNKLINFKKIDGVEVNKFAVKNLIDNPTENPYKNIYNDPIQDFQSNEKYDYGILVEVLEHLYVKDVIPVLQNLSNICENLIITTPHPSSCFQLQFNLEEIKNTLNNVTELNKNEFESLEGAIHKSTVTPFSMRQAGFKVLKHDYSPNYVNRKVTSMIYTNTKSNIKFNRIRTYGIQSRNNIYDLKLNYLNLLVDSNLFFPMFNYQPTFLKKISYYLKKLKSFYLK